MSGKLIPELCRRRGTCCQQCFTLLLKQSLELRVEGGIAILDKGALLFFGEHLRRIKVFVVAVTHEKSYLGQRYMSWYISFSKLTNTKISRFLLLLILKRFFYRS